MSATMTEASAAMNEAHLDRIDRCLRLLERIAAAVEHAPEPAQTQHAESGDDGLWTVKETAAYLRCSTSKIYQHAESWRLPMLRVGGSLRFEPAAVRAYARGETSPAARVVPLR